MVRRSKKIVGAWISLMLEKHQNNQPFQLHEILFTRSEIHVRTVEIFQMGINDYVIKQITVGGPTTSRDTYFMTGTDNSLNPYYWLCRPDEYSRYDVDEIIDSLLSSQWKNKTHYKTREQITAVMEEYFSFIADMNIPDQEEQPDMISREAVWIAAATLTYNEFIRTGSRNAATYQYPRNLVGLVAHSFNSRNTKSTLSQMAWNSCTAGIGEQPWSYLVNTGGIRRESRRRLSYYGEFEYTQPNLHEDFKIITITGLRTVKQLSEFIKHEFSPIFYKQLVPPLDASHTIEELEEHARQMDYNSLRAAAVGRGELHPEQRLVQSSRYERDPYIATYAKERAGGVCQLCHNEAPFRNNRNEPYLETHHILWLSQGGSDSVDNVVALCPNCHRKMHIVNSADEVFYLRKLVMSGK